MEIRSKKKEKQKYCRSKSQHITRINRGDSKSRESKVEFLFLKATYALPIYPPFILSLHERDPSSCFFSPRLRNRAKRKRKEKKNSGLGVFQEKRNAGG
jgi:hypothetical protein